MYINDQLAESQPTFPVLDGANSQGPWESMLNLYYASNEFSSATVYYKGFTIATTQAAAEAAANAN
jgi:hypothetical protein